MIVIKYHMFEIRLIVSDLGGVLSHMARRSFSEVAIIGIIFVKVHIEPMDLPKIS